MKVLITGGAGFIGSHIADFFIKKGDEVIIIDDFSSGKEKNPPKKAKILKGSILNAKLLNKAIKGVDYVFHLAAVVSVPLSFKHPKKCYDVNATGTKNVLEASFKEGVKKLIFSSSASIYGNNKNLPLSENEPYAPMNPYAKSKVFGEKLCLEYAKKGLKTAILRYFNVYGKRQDPKSQYSGVISIFADKAKQNKDILIYGDGNQTRDFIYIGDVVSANVLVMEKGSGIYNAANGNTTSIKHLAQKIIKLSKSNSKIIYKNQREGDIKYSRANIDKIKKLGFIPKVNLEKGLLELI